MFLICLAVSWEYLTSPLPIKTTITQIAADQDQSEYLVIDTKNGRFRTQLTNPEELPVNSSIRLLVSPILSDIYAFKQNETWRKTAFNYYEFTYLPVITCLLALTTMVAMTFKLRWWFYTWFLSMIGLFLCLLTFIITR